MTDDWRDPDSAYSAPGDRGDEQREQAAVLAKRLCAMLRMPETVAVVALAHYLLEEGIVASPDDSDLDERLMERLRREPFALVGTDHAERYYFSFDSKSCDGCGAEIERADLFLWVGVGQDSRFAFCTSCAPAPDDFRLEYAIEDSTRRMPSLAGALNAKYGWDLYDPVAEARKEREKRDERIRATVETLSSESWFTCRDVADRVDVHTSTARGHLAVMESEGLIERIDSHPIRWRVAS